ncbi:MAG: 2-oxo acid dehydrogenase subunit E2 [Gammaproteobacteria bacterium]|nr:2-oxo acid dehydrogenase subunit E2 [Gammaproteobacteria bacterium]
MIVFKLPDLGEGLPDAEIREWHIKTGDLVEVDQPLVSMETAKAVVEVPSPYKGKIAKLYGQAGDVIDTGTPLIEFDLTHSVDSQNSAPNQPVNPVVSDNSSTVAGKIEAGNEVIDETSSVVSNRNNFNNSHQHNQIKVTPAVRALASKLGVDLSHVKPTGANGVITADDVKNADASQAEIGDAEPLRGVRRIMSVTMAQSHNEVAPATLFDEADIHHWFDSGTKQDITIRLISAMVAACQAEPSLNAWFDSKNNTRRISKNIHLGFAVDTEEGLFVPVLKNIEKSENSDPATLRDYIDTIKSQVKSRSIPQDLLHGNTITLSNIGTIAGKFACPVVVPPTVAIVAIGRTFDTVKLNTNNMPVNHQTLPISLTFDHRCVTGGEAARFLKAFICHLEQ